MDKKSDDKDSDREEKKNATEKTNQKSRSSSSSSSSSEDSDIPPVAPCQESVVEVNKDGSEDVGKEVQDVQPSKYEMADYPAELTIRELFEASEGINRREAERNENFDCRFYKNQVAVRQHNIVDRPMLDNGPRQVEGESQTKFYVIAKRVAEPSDEACWITVSQSKHLGSGRFSDVYHGSVIVGNKFSASTIESQSPVPVAIKKLWPDKSREDLQICTHRILHHQNIIELLFYYVCVHPESKLLVWMMILEPMPSTLSQEHAKSMNRQRLMPRTVVKLFTYQLMSGLSYMERKQVLHRDIKPDNLLVDMETGRLKIGDLGSSKLYRENCPSSSYIVTRYYRAPELCLKYKYYDATVDVWSAGCILCGLLTNRVIFFGQNNDDQLQKIVKICGTPTREQMRRCAPGIDAPRSIYQQKYPTANWYRILRCFNDKITFACADFVGSVLRYETDNRLRGEKALNHEFFDSLRDPKRRLRNGRPLPVLMP